MSAYGTRRGKRRALPPEADTVKLDIDAFKRELTFRKSFWRPRDLRMDHWFLMYKLIDAFQAAKPPTRRRFVSNEPQTVIDKGTAILSRHPVQWRIALETAQNDAEMKVMEAIEQLLIGSMNQIDRDLIKRGRSHSRRIAAQHALLRGWIAWRFALKQDTKHPYDYEPYDSRHVYPQFDHLGLHSVIVQSTILAGEIRDRYPKTMPVLGITETSDPMQVYSRFEYIDREHIGVAAAANSGDALVTDQLGPAEWLEKPLEHGRDDIPFAMVPVNGVEVRYTPSLPAVQPITRPSDELLLNSRRAYERLPNAWVADWGRSIMASIEEQVPQFNEMIATIWQITSNNAFGTWVANTRSGRAIPIKTGENAVNWMDLNERLTRLGGDGAPPDLSMITQLLGSQIQRGTFSYVLYGDAPFQGSGYLFAQIEQAALNSLEPFRAGVKNWAELLSTAVIEEFRSGKASEVQVSGRDSRNRLFITTVDPKTIEKGYYIEAEIRPALPDDMMTRVQMARLLLDPRRPIASLQTVFDRVLQWPDARGELDRIFEDIAYTDPLIVLDRVAEILKEHGAEEYAEALRERQFRMAFMEEAAFKIQSAQAGMALNQMGGGGTPPGALPPEAQGMPTEGGPPTPAGGAEPGMGAAGMMGYTNGAR